MVGADGRDLEGWAPGLGTAAWSVGSRHGLIQRQEAADRQREEGGLRLPHLSTTPVDAFAASTKLLGRCVRGRGPATVENSPVFQRSLAGEMS